MTNPISRRNFLKTAIVGSAYLALTCVEAELKTIGLGRALAGELVKPAGKKPIVVLDPGHGMGNRKKGLYDPGCVYDGVEEAEIVLEQAEKISRILSDRGIRVFSTRIDQVTETPLKRRPLAANKANADIYVSLHANAADSKKAYGVRTYHFPNSERARLLGRNIQDGLLTDLKEKLKYEQHYDGLKTEDFYVLEKTKMPAVLVESGFLSNPDDRKILTSYPDVFSEGIAKSILSHLHVV